MQLYFSDAVMNKLFTIPNFWPKGKSKNEKHFAKCSSVIPQYTCATQETMSSGTFAGIIIFFFQFFLSAQAQINFKTIVPQQPVVAGESFQVQYIIEDGDLSMNVKPPVFGNFRFVAGPNIYSGSVSKTAGAGSLKNTVYTLQAVRPGKFLILGATINIDGKIIKSNDAFVEVISREEALKIFSKENDRLNSNYFLRPGENPYEKIERNLFIKVMVDKKNCYVGEPVLATFKLYSRLESKSDIVKNPGFYGFTIYDVINLADNQVATENVNGKLFDVHTIRKVQLYPLQAGTFSIDPMEVKNSVEFSKSAVSKKTEQEIVEGVLNDDKKEVHEGTETYETNISTESLTINVKAVPSMNKPDSFNGATGHFTIASSVANNKLAKDEQGFFAITLTGKGNFIQLSAPSIKWPAGIEGFEPTVEDVLDKKSTPLKGSRTFRYPFVCDSPGIWQLPPVSISFFDIDSNTYKTISTSPVSLTVSAESKNKLVIEEHKTSIAEKSAKASRIAISIVTVLVLLILVFLIFKKKEPEKLSPVQQEKQLISIDNLLQPARDEVATEGNRFYSVLHGIVWKFAADKFHLSGSEMNKQTLAAKMDQENLSAEIKNEMLTVINDCETGLYTTADLEENKINLLSETNVLLKKLV